MERDGDGVPRGSFELDPASVPTDLLGTPKKCVDFEGKNDNEKEKFEVSRSRRELISTGEKCCQGGPAKNLNGTFAPSKVNASPCLADENINTPLDTTHKSSSKDPSIPSLIEAFSNFCKDKSVEKFQSGQIWAFIGYVGPGNYGLIYRIETSPSFIVRVALLEACKPLKRIVPPVCCGLFKVQNNRLRSYGPSFFSHLVKPHCKGNMYEIYPREGEIWALYKSWNADMEHFNLSKFGAQIVLILNDNNQCTKVSFLVRVTGFRSLFRAQRSLRSNSGVLEVPRSELSRFAYRIPAFRLTEEKGDLLRGCWELDFLKVQGHLLQSLHIEDENVGDAHAQNLEGLVGAKVTQNKQVVAPLSNNYCSSTPHPGVVGSASGASAPKVFRSSVAALMGVSKDVFAKSAAKVTGSNPTPPHSKRRKLLNAPTPSHSFDRAKDPLAEQEKLGASAKVKASAATEDADCSFLAPDLERIPVSWSLRNKMRTAIPTWLSNESIVPGINHSIMDGMDHMATNLGEMVSGLTLFNAQVGAMRIAESKSQAAAEEKIESLCTKLEVTEEALNSARNRAEAVEAERKKLQEERDIQEERAKLAESELEKQTSARAALESSLLNIKEEAMVSGLALFNAQVEAMRIAESNSRAAAEAKIESLCTKLKATESALNSARNRTEAVEAERKKLQEERDIQEERAKLAESELEKQTSAMDALESSLLKIKTALDSFLLKQ